MSLHLQTLVELALILARQVEERLLSAAELRHGPAGDRADMIDRLLQERESGAVLPVSFLRQHLGVPTGTARMLCVERAVFSFAFLADGGLAFTLLRGSQSANINRVLDC